MKIKNTLLEYTVVGAGPAALCAITKLIHLGVLPHQILWIDPLFKVGDFGTKLSVGSSIPSNTKVMHFQNVNEVIYEIIPSCAPTNKERKTLDIYSFPSESHCPLRIAAEPMQMISDKLRKLVRSLEGRVLNIEEQEKGLALTVQMKNNLFSQYSQQSLQILFSKRVILAIGATPKTLFLPEPFNKISVIDPYVGFIQSEAEKYIKNNPDLKTLAIFGSSHSAALAVMNFRRAGIAVKQFMNKPYRFAVPRVSPTGQTYTQYDNTGLKGEVAEYVKNLLEQKDTKNLKDWNSFNSCLDIRSTQEALASCSHVLAAIGFEIVSTLHVNGISANQLSYNKHTTAINNIKNLFGFGIAFPEEVKAVSGESEPAVGYSKFWMTANASQVINAWTKT